MQLSNDKLCIKVHDDGRISIIDCIYKGIWETKYIVGWIMENNGNKIPFPTPERVDVRNNMIEVVYSNESSKDSTDFRFSIKVYIILGKDYLDIEISEVKTNKEWLSIEYPSHLINVPSSSNGYIVVPYHQGIIIPTKINAGFMRYMHNTWMAITDIERTLLFDSGSINMCWFGAQQEESSILCINLTPEDSALHIIGNINVNREGVVAKGRYPSPDLERISSLSPIWLPSHRELRYPRKIRIKFVDDGYVGMCKEYLSYSKMVGRYKSLSEKSRENPNIRKIIGAPDIKIYIYTNRKNEPIYKAWSGPILNGYSKVHTTFKNVEKIVSRLKSETIDNALILLAGWNRAGYDREHIDVWPPNELAGGINGLKSLSNKVIEQGYLLALHDNYQDFYPDAPSYNEKYIMKDEKGSIKFGGVWDGGLCHLICSSQMKTLLERNLNLIKNSININSYYLDTITAAPLYECYDANHPITRREDKLNKFKVLEFLAEKGLVVGGEGGTDWAISVCTFFEGLPGSAVGYFSGVESSDFGIAVPLFNLVYHDAVICYWQHGQPFGREDHANHVLHDILTGQPSSWSIIYEQFEDMLPLIKQSYFLLGKLHKKLAFCKIIKHRFISEDFAIQKTCFEDGTEIIINFGITSFETDKFKVPPKGFAIYDNDKDKVTIGKISRDIEYLKLNI